MTVGTEINPGWVWDDHFPFAQARQVGNFLLISGQIAMDPKATTPGKDRLVGQDVKQQTRQIFANIEAVLKASGGTLDNLVRITAYLTDIEYFKEYNEARAEILKDRRPASTTVAVSGLALGALVEIEAIAYV